ncbi:MAG: CBS domain-containing protein [Deltaproteobacteria bacterium]|nr:CBS domain-containing protein [Deltaproteobacteria bacterium]
MKRERGPDTIVTCHMSPDFDAAASMAAAGLIYPGSALLFPGGQNRRLTPPFVKGVFSGFRVAKFKDLDLKEIKRLVVVDTRQEDRVGLAAPILEIRDLEVHLYDHHPDTPKDIRGSLVRAEKVGATVTILTEIIRERGIRLSADMATMLALGLYEDTGNFTYPSATPRDLLACAYLLEKGADLETVSSLTSEELNASQLSLLNELVTQAEVRELKGVAIGVSMAARERHVDDVSVLAPRLLDILDLDTVFILVQMENLVQLVGRSRKSGLNVGEVARALSGGGHVSAAASVFKGLGLKEARERLDAALAEAVGRLFQAGNIMVRPAIGLSETRPLSEAMDMMSRYGLNVVLAEDALGRVSGVISEQSVAKAMYHGLTAYPVQDFMVSDFVTAAPETPFSEVERIIAGERQRILPVVDPAGKALGVITRTDLLRLLSSAGGGDDKGIPRNPFGRDLSALMEERLSEKTLSMLREMGELAQDLGMDLYLVGGTARDLVMLRPMRDLDLTLTGELSLFLREYVKKHEDFVLKSHPRFKTATLFLADGSRLDFSSARVEYYEYPGALPVVRHASIQLDLQRRDFTVNTLALSLAPREFGKLLDYYRGYQDIKEGVIRVLHSLSIVEDPTRAFRAARFENRLGFTVSKMTASLILNAVSGGFIKNLSLKRLMTELKLICLEESPGAALLRLSEFGLLKAFSPDLKVERRRVELFKRVDRVRDWCRLTFGSGFGPMWLVYFLALTQELDLDAVLNLADNLGEDSRRQARALASERPTLDRIANGAAKYQDRPDLALFEAEQIYGNLSRPGALYVMARAGSGPLARAGALFLSSFRRVTAEISRDELLTLGFRPGEDLEKAREILKNARRDGLVSLQDEDRDYVRRYLAALPGAGLRSRLKPETPGRLERGRASMSPDLI